MFNLIVADPPWSFDDTLKKMKAKTKRSAASQYNLMSHAEVASIDVKSVTDPSWCVCVLWVPSTLVSHGLDVLASWGFSFKQTFVWVKIKNDVTKTAKKSLKDTENIDPNELLAFGMGRLFRATHEIALVGTSGKPYDNLQDRSQRSVMLEVNTSHSSKPETLQDRLEKMFPTAKKLEMFARRTRQGWTCLGNEIDCLDINDAIALLSKQTKSVEVES